MSHASERKKLERRAYYQRYPCFVLDDASCADKSEQFVEAIRQAASKVRFDAPEIGLKLGNLECLKLFRKVGYDGVRQAMGDMPMHMVTQLLHLTAGEALIRVVDERDPTILDRFAPFSTALVQPTSNVFHHHPRVDITDDAAWARIPAPAESVDALLGRADL